MQRQTVLIIDDEPDILELLDITLRRMKLVPFRAETAAQARELLDENSFDLCLTDMRLPDGSGLEIIQYIQQYHPHTPVAMITAFGSIETAIQSLKAGAFDFISKPIDLNTLREIVISALRLDDETELLGENENSPLLGSSLAMIKLRKQIKKLARSQAPIYICGESGSGKELAARQIHALGPRVNEPFIPVNCGAIPADLIESELFGHKRGSFSGAVNEHQGLFQAANGGTLFLDEVADLPLNMQVKLLRAIQEKAIRPVGAAQEINVDVRFLCATHKDLAQEVQEGRFRQDLYYRLNVIELRIPPLRERHGDIALLCDYILKALNQDDMQVKLHPLALKKLESYSFPGNVRELENVLERAYTLCDNDVILADDLQLTPAIGGYNSDAGYTTKLAAVDNLEDHLEEIERDVIVQALDACHWNKTAAAERLGLSFRSLRYRLKKLGID